MAYIGVVRSLVAEFNTLQISPMTLMSHCKTLQ